jgi:hypothetical protein
MTRLISTPINAAAAGAVHQPHQPRHDDQRHDDDNDLDVIDRRTAKLMRHAVERQREGVVFATPYHHRQVLQHNGNADGGNQRRQARRVAQGAIGDALDAVTQCHAYRHRHHQAEQYRQHRRQRRSQQGLQHGERDHRTYHHHFAMREIDQTEDAVHHGVAQCHQGIHAALHQAVDDLLKKDFQG